MPNVPPDAIDRARALFGDFTEGRWEQARGKLHQDMRGRVDVVGHIAHWWAHTASPRAVSSARVSRPRASSADTPWWKFR